MGQRRAGQVMAYVDLILGRSAISKFKFGIPRAPPEYRAKGLHLENSKW